MASSRCRRWYKPGLLLIGDAAHTMTPFAGSGIKYAIEDAVVAANMLAEPLKEGRVGLRDLVAVQRKRELPTRVIQAFGTVSLGQMGRALRSGRPLSIPRVIRWMFSMPVVSKLVARLFAFGMWRVRVQDSRA